MTKPLTVFLSYAGVIVATLIASGLYREKTLYDNYLINMEGGIFEVSDLKVSADFYKNVLNFTEFKGKIPPMPSLELTFQLPGKKKLFLVSAPQSSTPTPAGRSGTVIRVRNGFEKLHSDLLSRLGQSLPAASNVNTNNFWENMKAQTISEIFTGPWGQHFVVCDPDRNMLIFYGPGRILFGSTASAQNKE